MYGHGMKPEEPITKRGRGRPPGSKNKPKEGVAPKDEGNDPLIKDGFPNLPVVSLIGRPQGAKDKAPRHTKRVFSSAQEYTDFMRSNRYDGFSS